jgi:hypothetical protein
MGSQEEKRAKIIAAQAAREAADRAAGRLPPLSNDTGSRGRGKKGPPRAKAVAAEPAEREEIEMPELPELPDTSDF